MRLKKFLWENKERIIVGAIVGYVIGRWFLPSTVDLQAIQQTYGLVDVVRGATTTSLEFAKQKIFYKLEFGNIKTLEKFYKLEFGNLNYSNQKILWKYQNFGIICKTKKLYKLEFEMSKLWNYLKNKRYFAKNRR